MGQMSDREVREHRDGDHAANDRHTARQRLHPCEDRPGLMGAGRVAELAQRPAYDTRGRRSPGLEDHENEGGAGGSPPVWSGFSGRRA